jgi:NTE family protein
VSEADWARSRLRLGLELSSDFSDSNSFGVVAMHIAPSLNDWGAELRTIARLGTRRSISIEWWQPLGVGSDWFVAPAMAYEASAADAFANGLRTARVGFREARATLALGRQLADWGDLRVGVTRTVQRGRVLVPAEPSIDERFAGSSRFLQLRVDTLEPIAYPVRGQLLQATWAQTLGSAQDRVEARTSQVVSLAAFSSREWGGHVYAEWSKARSGFAPSTLGGFLRLSGTDPQSVAGQTVVLGRLLLARRIGELPPPFGAAIRAGFSLEAGAGFAPEQSVRLGQLKQAGSAFLALDTRFGPLYLGTGATRGSTGTVYLFLGPVW